MSTLQPLVIYHAHCPDGFTAAWVVAGVVGECELFPASYGYPPPYELARERAVYIVDFSYPRAQLELMHSMAASLMVLDHHKTAEADLRGLPYCVFDMNRSGAGLAWDVLRPGEPRPWLVDYVEDRDLWRFSMPNAHGVALRIKIVPHTLAAYDALAKRTLTSILAEAFGAQLYVDHYVIEVLRNLYKLDNVDGQGSVAACVNVPYTNVSDVLHAALKLTDLHVAIGWHMRPDKQLDCSVRSRSPYDCSVLAKQHGGGGHAQAAGFRVASDSSIAQRLMFGGATP